MDHYDVVIVGSGFGASVLAARLGAHLQGRGRVLVLEKGMDPVGLFDPEADDGPELNAQGNRFRHSLAPEYLANVAEVFTDSIGQYRPGQPSMSVAAGKGLGGGSNVYCGVSLRAPSEVFDLEEDGRRLWPSVYSRAALDPYYDIVEAQLRVHRMHWTTEGGVPHWQLCTKRDFVFAEGCRRIGATATGLKLADADDANEGWWTQGQRFEGRQDLTKNYLLDALAAGVAFRTRSEVDSISPDGDAYVVSGVDRRSGGAVRFDVSCTLLFVSAGCIGSTGLLLRSQDAFRGERLLDLGADMGVAVLGRNLSSNGDYGVAGIVGEGLPPTEPHKGKPMSSFSPSFWRQHKFVLIPFHTPPVYLTQGRYSTLLPASNPDARGRGTIAVRSGDDGRPVPDWGLEYKQLLEKFPTRMLTMGCLALDRCEGEVQLGPAGTSLEVVWRQTSGETEERWSTAFDTMSRIYEALGGEVFADSYRLHGTVHTAHPLGGARMSDDPSYGIVDPLGESFTNENLFVVDGAILPSALGVNPSLTIAAVAECIADRLIRGAGTRSLDDRL